MTSIRHIVVCFMVLLLLNGSIASAKSVSPVNKVSWDGFHQLQPSDMNGHQDSLLYQWAITRNIIEGYPDNTLKPEQLVTEAEFLKMLYRGFGLAIPTQIFPTKNNDSYDWKDALYRVAQRYNHPTLGSINPKMRKAPLSRLHAAEIISAAQGVNYDGLHAVTYIIGNHMTVHGPLTIEEFHPEDTITRTEALQWIRQLTLKGMMEIKQRPKEATDLSLLPVLPIPAVEATPPFSSVLLTNQGLNLFGTHPVPEVAFGASKKTVDEAFGVSEELDISNLNIYPLFSARFNENGLLDAWQISQRNPESTTLPSTLKTNNGILLGESTLFDVLREYGTYGYLGDGLANYLYEKTADGAFQPLPFISYYPQIENPENVYVLSFIIDRDTLKVTYAFASWAPSAYRV